MYLSPTWALLLAWHSFTLYSFPLSIRQHILKPYLAAGRSPTLLWYEESISPALSSLGIPGKSRFSFLWNLACLPLENPLLTSQIRGQVPT